MGQYIPPSVRAIRDQTTSAAVISGGDVTVGVIGRTNGALTLKPAVATVRGAVGLIDNLTDLVVNDVVQVRTLQTGGVIYTAGTDFTFVAPNQISWNATVIAPPYMFPVTVLTTGGTFAAGTYFYVITAQRITAVAAGPTAAAVTSGSAATWALANGQLVALKVDGGADLNAIFTATQGQQINTNQQGTGYVLANNETLLISVNGGAVQTVTFVTADFANIALATTLEVVNEINKQLVGAHAFAVGSGATSTIELRSDLSGNTSSIQITGGTANSGGTNPLNFPTTVGSGGGNVGNIAAVRGSEAQSIMAAAFTGTTVTLNSNGTITITHNTTGASHNLQVDVGTTTALAFNFPTTLNSGTNTGAPTIGETTVSNEVSGIVALNGEIKLSWSAVNGASGYKIYRATSSGGYGAASLLATLVGQYTTSYIDTGTATGTGQPPVTNTALARPAVGATYYVDYHVITFTYFADKQYFRLTDVVADHGMGSDIATAATLIMGKSGKGNAAVQMWAMAVPDITLPTMQAAFTVRQKTKNITIQVPLSSDFATMQSLEASILTQSSVDNQNETFGFVGAAQNTPIGDGQTPGTAIYQIQSLNNRRMWYAYPWATINYQSATGAVTATAFDGWAVAAAVGGMISTLPDRAEPPTNKTVQGIVSLGLNMATAERNLVASNGGFVIYQDQGNFVVQDAFTTSLDSIDQHVNINLVDDLLIANLRSNFNQYRGHKLTSKLLDLVQDKTKDVLGKMVKFTLINFFDPDSISVQQDTAIPTRILIFFTYGPIYPARILEFHYAFDLRTVAPSNAGH